MYIRELKEKFQDIKNQIVDHGNYQKENQFLDYKKEMSINSSKNEIENFLTNFLKDILSFANSDWWILLLWFEEDWKSWIITDIWLNTENLDLIEKIDWNLLSQQINSITWQNCNFDFEKFNIASRIFYAFLISKSDEILIPNKDCKDYWNVKKWNIYHRIWSTNTLANENGSTFNSFLQIKANEKSKEFMEIWSNLLPEMVDINPKEVLILNPVQNKVYWFNWKTNTLSWTEIDVVKDHNDVFNIILQSIKAWDIGKITSDKWKPLYRIVWDINQQRDYTSLSSIIDWVKKVSWLNISSNDIKIVMYDLGWVNDKKFKVMLQDKTLIDFIENDAYLWFEQTDSLKKRGKIVFNPAIIDIIVNKLNEEWYQEKKLWKCLNKIKNN